MCQKCHVGHNGLIFSELNLYLSSIQLFSSSISTRIVLQIWSLTEEATVHEWWWICMDGTESWTTTTCAVSWLQQLNNEVNILPLQDLLILFWYAAAVQLLVDRYCQLGVLTCIEWCVVAMHRFPVEHVHETAWQYKFSY